MRIASTARSNAGRARGAIRSSSSARIASARRRWATFPAGAAGRRVVNSAGERAKSLNKEGAQVGVGIVGGSDAGGRRDLLVTQVFLKPPEPFGPHTVEDLRRQIGEWRRAHHLQSLASDVELD